MQESAQIQNYLGMTAVIASPPMHRLMRTLQRLAGCSAPVLITGESGSGKELVARALHHYSPRSGKPWVDVSCAALPDHLVESEMFGHEKGAFSGADSLKPGLFELADKGTLYLDEIGELDARVQVKLLRVLDGVPYYRLGGVRKVSADVRILAATNRDLEEAVRRGRFRSDLYHRLNQLSLRVPPLRERREDIRLLSEFFLNQIDPGLEFSPDVLAALEHYGWPGNVRELRNVIHWAALAGDGRLVSLRDLPVEVRCTEAAAEKSPGCASEK